MRRDHGFILIAALWLLVALSAVGLELSLALRTRRLAAANALEETRARWAAVAGVEQARARLERWTTEARAGEDPWSQAARAFADTMSLGDSRYRVVLRDLGTAVNLNRASDDELRRLFVALRIDPGEADRLAQAILDWRDPDDDHRARGAERDAYIEEQRAELPRNGPFGDLTELLAVKGMSSKLYELVAPSLTLLGSGRINLNTAERPVLLTLPGMSDQAVGLLLRLRRQGRRVHSLSELEALLSNSPREGIQQHFVELLGRTTFEARELEILSEGWADGSPVRVRLRGLVVRSGNVAFPIWRRFE